MSTLRAAIVGPTGYTGRFLIPYLLRHPAVRLTYLASRRDPGPDLRGEFPELSGLLTEEEARCRPIEPARIAQAADVAFLTLPHKAAMSYAPRLLEAGLRVIDLSADYRLSTAEAYEAVYGVPHEDPTNLRHAVYGLPELMRERITPKVRLIANPGCYPTASALAIAPLLAGGLVEPSGVLINAASGVTGAGRTPKDHLHFPELNESFYAYGAIGNHRHQHEIQQTLRAAGHAEASPLFVPHLLPLDQGILATVYLTPKRGVDQRAVDACLDAAYQSEPFVRLRDQPPNLKHVRNTNFCDLHAKLIDHVDPPRLVVFSAIDNMVKGAVGQAVQNMNLIFGLPEAQGLR